MYKPRIPGQSPLAQILKEYRGKYDITQEQLANELSIDVRTLRRYENGESAQTDINELRRIASILGIDSERLGILPDLSTPEEIDATIDRLWHLVRVGRNYEANIAVDRLMHNVTGLIKSEDTTLLRRLAHAQHLAGYVKSVITRSNEVAIPYAYYQAMEQTARLLNDQTLLNIALTYQGDMLVRGNDVNRGIIYHEAARDTTPLADISARGNGIQLLGRAYLRASRLSDFDRAMKESEELAHQLDTPNNTSAKGQYSLGTVLEEYGRSYAQLGDTNKAMDYLDQAEKSLDHTEHWEILLKTARAIALVRGGEIKQGVNVAVESVALCKQYGTIRLMERILGVQQYIDRLTKEIGTAGNTLREALYGPIEY